MRKEIIDWRIIITVIISITVLEAIALFQGINGILLSTVLVILAGLGGWAIPSPRSV